MASTSKQARGPDLSRGVSLADFGGRRMLRGYVGDDDVLLAQVGDEVLAISAQCSHYGGELADGALAGDTVRCPLHHACFSLRTGEALAAPAFEALACWKVERTGDRIVVRERIERPPSPSKQATKDAPASVVIVGGGAAGFACAEGLRRRGHAGPITLLSAEADAPCDRPNLSKDYLAGEAPEDWIPLRPDEFYTEHRIDLQLQAVVTGIDSAGRNVRTGDGRIFAFDRLLLAPGAEPVRPPIPGADQAHVFTLRSLADSRAIIARAAKAKTAVVLGSGFIGLETAAALRTRGLLVHVVSLDAQPLERVLGTELGAYIRGLHERRGVAFHMTRSIASIAAASVTLDDGSTIDADVVVLGVGVRPRTALAESAGLSVDHGILVDEFLETGTPGIYVAGDAARWRDPGSDQTRRVEHWVVAERQGQVVAENMLGGRVAYRDVPFFWSAHYDTTLRYAGYAPAWDAVDIDGDLAAGHFLATYREKGAAVAVAGVGRDAEVLAFRQSLEG